MRDIIEMAKAVGYPLMVFDGKPYVSPELQRLVAAVRAAEREACAMVCTEIGGMGDGYDCAAAIRARSGEQK
jgi:hypothetical protein